MADIIDGKAHAASLRQKVADKVVELKEIGGLIKEDSLL